MQNCETAVDCNNYYLQQCNEYYLVHEHAEIMRMMIDSIMFLLMLLLIFFSTAPRYSWWMMNWRGIEATFFSIVELIVILQPAATELFVSASMPPRMQLLCAESIFIEFLRTSLQNEKGGCEFGPAFTHLCCYDFLMICRAITLVPPSKRAGMSPFQLES